MKERNHKTTQKETLKEKLIEQIKGATPYKQYGFQWCQLSRNEKFIRRPEKNLLFSVVYSKSFLNR
jgi:hypothetical protein